MLSKNFDTKFVRKEILFDESDYVCIPDDDDDDDEVFATSKTSYVEQVHGCLRTIRGKLISSDFFLGK